MAEVLIVSNDPRGSRRVVSVLARLRVRGVRADTLESAHRALEGQPRWRGFICSAGAGGEPEPERALAAFLAKADGCAEHRRAPKLVHARIDSVPLVRFAFEAHASGIDDPRAKGTVARLGTEARLTPAQIELLAAYVRLRPIVEGDMRVALATDLEVSENTIQTNLRALVAKLRARGAPRSMAAIDRWIRAGSRECADPDERLTHGG